MGVHDCSGSVALICKRSPPTRHQLATHQCHRVTHVLHFIPCIMNNFRSNSNRVNLPIFGPTRAEDLKYYTFKNGTETIEYKPLTDEQVRQLYITFHGSYELGASLQEEAKKNIKMVGTISRRVDLSLSHSTSNRPNPSQATPISKFALYLTRAILSDFGPGDLVMMMDVALISWKTASQLTLLRDTRSPVTPDRTSDAKMDTNWSQQKNTWGWSTFPKEQRNSF